MNWLIEHPFLTYIAISILCGMYLSLRMTPEALRIKADNYRVFADKIEEIQRSCPHPAIWSVAMLITGFAWVIVLPKAIFRTLYAILWGEERVKFHD